MHFKLIALILMLITFIFDMVMKYLDVKSAEREVPDNVKDVYDEASYQKWLAYDKEKNRLSLIRYIISSLCMFLLIGLNVYALIIEVCGIEGLYLSGNMVLVFDLVISSFYVVPFSYVDTMKIEQKYGFNRMTKKTFIIDQIKDVIINLIILCGLMSLFILLHQTLGNLLLPVFTLLMMLLLLVIVFIAPLMGKIYNKFEPLEEGTLRERLTMLLEENGCTVRDIKVMDSSKRSTKANAYFSGFGKMKTIVLYDTLLEQMTEDEIVAIFAHEMGHNKHKDTLKMYAMNLLNIVIMVLIAYGLVSVPAIYEDFGFEGINYGFAFILLSAVCLSFISPLIGLFTSLFSRKFEYAADRFAAENGYGESLITGLKKLARNSFVCLSPHPFLVMLTYSHPTISQRIDAIEAFMKERENTCQKS